LGDQGKSTREHIGQFLAQLGELADTEAFRVRLFSLSLIETAFAWYATLPPNSILSWGDLEQNFHDHFFSGDYELDLVDLVALWQGKDESINEYIRRFRDTRNRCFQIHLAEKQLAGLAFNGLRYYLKERLEGIRFFTLAQLHQRDLACESRSKETAKIICHNVHIVECDKAARMTNQQKYTQLKWFGQSRPNPRLVPPCSWFKRNDKKMLSLHLMLVNVTKYLMNYSKMATLK
jgi:hypothetical protein